MCNCEYDKEKEDTITAPPPPPPPKRAPKAVDEDLYKISPQLLHSKPTRVTNSSPSAALFYYSLFSHFFTITPPIIRRVCPMSTYKGKVIALLLFILFFF